MNTPAGSRIDYIQIPMKPMRNIQSAMVSQSQLPLPFRFLENNNSIHCTKRCPCRVRTYFGSYSGECIDTGPAYMLRKDSIYHLNKPLTGFTVLFIPFNGFHYVQYRWTPAIPHAIFHKQVTFVNPKAQARALS